MFTTSPWALYVYTAGPVIAGYYLFAVAKFYGREIRARINSRAALSRKRGESDIKATGREQQHEADSGLIQAQPGADSTDQSNFASPQTDGPMPAGHHDLAAHLVQLIEEAHQKDYDKQELILLLQMTIKDYLDFQGTQFQSAISQLIGNECAKYGSIHLGEKDKEAIWNRE